MVPWGLLHCIWILTSDLNILILHPQPLQLLWLQILTDAYSTSFLLPCPANPTSLMNFFLSNLRAVGGGEGGGEGGGKGRKEAMEEEEKGERKRRRKR